MNVGLGAITASDVVAAIIAIDKEAARRGEMFPQTSYEQREDRRAATRIIDMLKWYNQNTRCDNIAGWPKAPDCRHSAESVIEDLITQIGDDPARGGLRETPTRVIKAWKHWGSGYKISDSEVGAILKTFEDGAEDYDQFVIEKNIPVYSHCEHHLAPFFGTVSIGYIPDKHIVGLSKFTRLVEVYSRRLQVQERLTRQIADAIQQHLNPLAVGVVIECRHLCKESRGISTQGSTTTTSAIRGLLRTDAAAKAEFFRLIGR